MKPEQASETPDHILLSRFATEGDAEAFERLFRRYGRLVLGASQAVLGSRDSAEDVVGATFLLLSRKAEELCRRPILAGWLYQTATLLAQNERRRELAHERKLALYGSTVKFTTISEDPDQLEIAACVGSLPDSARKAVMLRYFGGLSYAEVGKMLGCSEDAARQRIQRSLESLAKMFASCGYAITSDHIEQALRAVSQECPPNWMSNRSRKLADSFERAKQTVRIRFAAIGVGACAIFLASPPLGNLALLRAHPGPSNPSVSRELSPPPARKPSIPALTGGFTLVYQVTSKDLPDPNGKELTLSYNGKTFMTKRDLGNGGKAVVLFHGRGVELFLVGAKAANLPAGLAAAIKSIESDIPDVDPDEARWRRESPQTMAPPLTRTPFLTDIPPVGCSLPNPLLSISLDGSYSWFMGDPKTALRDSNGNLTHFSAYDTTYNLFGYRPFGGREIAGQIVVRRTQGDFRGPDDYVLKSATGTPLPAPEFDETSYQKGEVMSYPGSNPAFPQRNKVYIDPNASSQTKAKLKTIFGVPNQ